MDGLTPHPPSDYPHRRSYNGPTWYPAPVRPSTLGMPTVKYPSLTKRLPREVRLALTPLPPRNWGTGDV